MQTISTRKDEEQRVTTPEQQKQQQAMLDACSRGDLETIHRIVQHANNNNNNNDIVCSQQDETTGVSPLMMAAANGHDQVVQYLLEEGGAPWNAVDRQERCAGDYATDHQHWTIVNRLVEWGTRAELILGRIQRSQREQQQQQQQQQVSSALSSAISGPASHQPCTKPDYLQQRLVYSEDGQSLLDADQDAVMMEWERPLMRAHAQILMETTTTDNFQHPVGKRVLNVGFGMGIIDTILHEQFHPSLHIIVEAHPDVYQRMLSQGWHTKSNVRICFGRWQDVLLQLTAEGCVVDAIFYDTYAEHALDFEDFHHAMTAILAKPHGVYSFFNGLAPDNLFFHGVACQCVQLQLTALGLDCEFWPCQIQLPTSTDSTIWNGVRRPYWHGRDTYYLPVVRWNATFLETGQAPEAVENAIRAEVKRKINTGESAPGISPTTPMTTAAAMMETETIVNVTSSKRPNNNTCAMEEATVMD